MTPASRLLPLAALVVATGAKPNEAGGFLLVGGLIAAFLVTLGLPLGLLLHRRRPDFLAAQARAVERRATACVLIGAGLVVAATFVVAACAPRAPVLAVLALAAAAAWFFVGFAGSARLHGTQMLAPGDAADSPRPLVLGWLARAGLFAVPVAWPFLAAYLVVVAFGAPVVALFDRGRADAPVTS
jgi:hypothetical protein